MHVYSRALTIEWGDCDPAGIVFYPRYFAMFDVNAWELFATGLGLARRAVLDHFDIIGFPMVDLRAKFLAPNAHGETVRIDSGVSEFRRSSFVIAHKIFRGELLTVEAFETRVWTGRHPDHPDRLKAKTIPREVIARLSGE